MDVVVWEKIFIFLGGGGRVGGLFTAFSFFQIKKKVRAGLMYKQKNQKTLKTIKIKISK